MMVNIINVTRGWVGVKFPGKKRYEGVRFKVISVTRGHWVGVKFPGKKRYITLERPPTLNSLTSPVHTRSSSIFIFTQNLVNPMAISS